MWSSGSGSSSAVVRNDFSFLALHHFLCVRVVDFPVGVAGVVIPEQRSPCHQESEVIGIQHLPVGQASVTRPGQASVVLVGAASCATPWSVRANAGNTALLNDRQRLCVQEAGSAAAARLTVRAE